ncbi:hypothetical protein [Nonomuraea sp. NPDC049725]|uniref:hypothetical protein n=1 Tax=Nonomuraea sp. NPDC049725 TaxID=3154508 RepID=UPI0034417D33
MHLRKHAAALSATALLTASALFGMASPANADPNCTTGVDSPKTAWAICTGYARYAVLIHVKHPNPNAGVGSWHEVGTCVSTGQRSEHTPYHSIPFTVGVALIC